MKKFILFFPVLLIFLLSSDLSAQYKKYNITMCLYINPGGSTFQTLFVGAGSNFNVGQRIIFILTSNKPFGVNKIILRVIRLKNSKRKDFLINKTSLTRRFEAFVRTPPLLLSQQTIGKYIVEFSDMNKILAKKILFIHP